MRKTGSYQTIGDLNYFIPSSLPPKDPSLQLTPEIMTLYGEANFALGQLNEISKKIPDVQRFVKAYIIKEALLSSAIEGIHTTLVDIFTQTLGDSKASKNTQLVLNYTHALNVALTMIQDEGLPLINRIILKSHEALMSLGDGENANPGNFRKQSVRVGALVPPPAHEITPLMSDLEKYIHEPSDIPPLLRAGLVHVQFETIHPFLDGNGRIGRLLIVLMLINDRLLDAPILYPSYYFKKYHFEYYQRLDRVRTHGDFEGWISFFLKSIRDSAIDAHRRANDIYALESRLQQLIETEKDFAKIKEMALAIVSFLLSQPITTVAKISIQIKKAYNTVQKVLNVLVKHQIISENIVHKRNKIYCFDQYLAVLEKEYSD